MLRFLVNKLYSRVRGIDSSIDPRVPGLYIASELATRAVHKIRAVLLLHPHAYIGSSLRLRGRGQVNLGRSTVIGRGVTLNGLAVEGIVVGGHCTIDDYAVIKGSGVMRNLGIGVRIGDRTSIGAQNTILGQGGVKIGSDCLFGPNVTLVSENHNFEDPLVSIRQQGETRSRIVVGNDVWIGAGATVLAGSTIGDGAIIAAGAVVRGPIEEYTIVGGIPARQIGVRGGNAPS